MGCRAARADTTKEFTMAVTTYWHEVGLLGLEAQVECDLEGKRPMMFLKDIEGRMVLLLRHEIIALRSLIETLDLS